MENFMTKSKRKSVKVIEFSDMTRIKEYQQSLIDFILYTPPKHKGGSQHSFRINQLYNEINKCEKWLKINWNLFMNDNHRQFDSPNIKFSKPKRAKLRGGYNR